jgi:Arc/MetJ family transcription regulator
MKTSIEIDRKIASEAAEILGTTTLRDTVDTALREVIRARLRHELADAVRAGTLMVPSIEDVERSKAPVVPIGALDGLDETFERGRRRRA